MDDNGDVTDNDEEEDHNETLGAGSAEDTWDDRYGDITPWSPPRPSSPVSSDQGCSEVGHLSEEPLAVGHDHDGQSLISQYNDRMDAPSIQDHRTNGDDVDVGSSTRPRIQVPEVHATIPQWVIDRDPSISSVSDVYTRNRTS